MWLWIVKLYFTNIPSELNSGVLGSKCASPKYNDGNNGVMIILTEEFNFQKNVG